MRFKSIQSGVVLAALCGACPLIASETLAIEHEVGVDYALKADQHDVTSDIDGDYNRDGIVDAGDYVLWRDTLGKSGEALSTDGNRDKMIGEADRVLWQSQFGKESEPEEESGAQAIPEPAAAALALMLLIAAGMWRWFDLRAAGNRR